MTPRAAVRITVPADALDDYGALSSVYFRELRGWLWGIPAEAMVTVDLGVMRTVDHLLIAELATQKCARRVLFEARDWRISEASALALTETLEAVRAR